MAIARSERAEKSRHLEAWLNRASRAQREHLLVGFGYGSGNGISWRTGKGDKRNIQIDVRQIIHIALNGGFQTLIIAHNHPSGLAKPSQQDIASTRALERCCHPLGIEIVDHLIVGNGEIFSFRDAGLL